MRSAAWLCAGLLLIGPTQLRAQDCTVVRTSRFNIQNQGAPNQIGFFYDAEIVCPGGKRLIADQAIQMQAAGRIELIGKVSYRDAERALTAQRAEYYRSEQRVHATGNVVLRDLRTGSMIYGEDIDYLQAIASRPEALLTARPATVRPRAVLRNRERTAGAGDSTNVVADMIEVRGDSKFRGIGSAIITRDSLTAYGGIADYDQATGELQLVGQGRVVGNQYQLLGDTILALIQEDTLREVNARSNANLTATAGNVEAQRIRIELVAGEVARMVAARDRDSLALRAPNRAPQPTIVAEEFRLAADSIDARAPGQELEEVIAVGDAFSSTNDTIPAPPGAGELQTALSTDWMRGDTVHAFFIENPRAATDTAADKRTLDRVVSTGNPASSLYRKRGLTAPDSNVAAAAADSAQVPAAAPVPNYEIGYLLARRIEVTLVDGEVHDVTASEDVRGVYLQPRTGASTQAARPARQRP